MSFPLYVYVSVNLKLPRYLQMQSLCWRMLKHCILSVRFSSKTLHYSISECKIETKNGVDLVNTYLSWDTGIRKTMLTEQLIDDI